VGVITKKLVIGSTSLVVEKMGEPRALWERHRTNRPKRPATRDHIRIFTIGLPKSGTLSGADEYFT
jgi:hypothetical protein